MHDASLAASTKDESRSLYLDLMKRSLTNWPYAETEMKPMWTKGFGSTVRRAIVRMVCGKKAEVMRKVRFDPSRRLDGRDWPPTAHTMIGLKRLNNLQYCVESVLGDDVPGDFIEAGVWRGGASIMMKAILRSYGVTDRTLWLADSFEGLPPPDVEKYPQDADSKFHTVDRLAVSLEQVQANFERYGLLDDQVRFLKGWFKDTLPTAPVGELALMRLDGDMYESTIDAISALYPKLNIGGFVIVDDYGAVQGCREAIHDYRKEHGITEEILPVDWTGAFWQRTE